MLVGKRVLVVGSGGREHALVWALARSPEVERIYTTPGNEGMAQLAVKVQVNADDPEALARWAKENRIDLTVVGPEAFLAKGSALKPNQNGNKIKTLPKNLESPNTKLQFLPNFLGMFGMLEPIEQLNTILKTSKHTLTFLKKENLLLPLKSFMEHGLVLVSFLTVLLMRFMVILLFAPRGLVPRGYASRLTQKEMMAMHMFKPRFL